MGATRALLTIRHANGSTSYVNDKGLAEQYLKDVVMHSLDTLSTNAADDVASRADISNVTLAARDMLNRINEKPSHFFGDALRHARSVLPPDVTQALSKLQKLSNTAKHDWQTSATSIPVKNTFIHYDLPTSTGSSCDSTSADEAKQSMHSAPAIMTTVDVLDVMDEHNPAMTRDPQRFYIGESVPVREVGIQGRAPDDDDDDVKGPSMPDPEPHGKAFQQAMVLVDAAHRDTLKFCMEAWSMQAEEAYYSKHGTLWRSRRRRRS